MINLVPPQGKKRIVREYWLRATTVWMLLVSMAFILFTFGLLPSLVFVNSLKNTMSEQFSEAMAANATYEQTEQQIKETNALINHLDIVKTEIVYSELLAELDEVAGDYADIQSFDFVAVNGELETINLVGVAQTRISLSSFRDALEAHPRFHSIDLPISSLAEERDINFSINVSFLGTDEIEE